MSAGSLLTARQAFDLWNKMNSGALEDIPEETKQEIKEAYGSLTPEQIETFMKEDMENGVPSPQEKKSPGALDKAADVLNTGRESFFPIMSGMQKSTSHYMKSKGVNPDIADVVSYVPAAAGGFADLASYFTGPAGKATAMAPKAAAKAWSIVPGLAKAGMANAGKFMANAAETTAKAGAMIPGARQVADLVKNLAKSPYISQTYGKNIATNTADAALFNNAARLANGEDMDFGASEVLGGLAGGTIAGTGEARFKKNIEAAKSSANRNNADMNFAQRNTGKKGLESIEEVIHKNIKPGESFEGAVSRLRKNGHELNNEFYKHFDSVKDLRIDISPQEILEDLDEYVIENSMHLGHSFTKKMSKELNETFEDYMRTIYQKRLIAQGKASTKKQALEMSDNMDLKQLYDEIGSLTLGDMDYMKIGMQKRTSAYNRGPGTQERTGLESLANKEGSEGILAHMRKQIDTDAKLSEKDKQAIAATLEGKFETTGNVDERYLKALKDNGIISGKDLSTYMDLNKARSENIGSLKIMERANDKLAMTEGRKSGIVNDLKRLNEAGREPLGAMSRNMASKAYDNRENIPGLKNIVMGSHNAEAKQDRLQSPGSIMMSSHNAGRKL